MPLYRPLYDGAVVFYIRGDVYFIILSQFNAIHPYIEILSLKLILGNSYVLTSVVYRPLRADCSQFMDFIIENFPLILCGRVFICLGDVNIEIFEISPVHVNNVSSLYGLAY